MTADRKIIWLTVNCSYSHSSLALPLVHSAAEAVSGWQWESLEIIRDEDSARIAALIAEKRCDLLCTVLYLFNRPQVMDILKRVHALAPEIRIAVGGPECPACDAGKILQGNPFISYVFSGEGEKIFADFLRDFDRWKEERLSIPGTHNAMYENWINATFPVCDPFFRTDKPFVQIETSRGCPMACAYCTSSGVNTRYRSLEQVEEELRLLHDKGVREIRVLDRTFNLPQERGAALLRLFSQFPDMRFHMEIHPQFLGEELRECFRSARPGQLHVEAGIQSLDPLVQRSIGRRSSVELALDGLQFLASCTAFETHTDLLSGLPEQTLSSLRNDIVELIQTAPAEIQLEILKILPGTPILRDIQKYGIVYSPEPPYDVMRTAAMSAADILESKKLSRLLDLFFNHEYLHPILVRASRMDKTAFLRLADQLIVSDYDLNKLMDLRKRFVFLAEFFKEKASVMEDISLQWVLAGYPAGDCPSVRLEPVRSIPENAVLTDGDDESRNHRESKFQMLKYGDHVLYFAYNRAFKFNKPCAVWKCLF